MSDDGKSDLKFTSSIIVCGQKFDIGQKVVTYEDNPSISAYTMHCVNNPSAIYPTQPAKGLGTIAARYRERRSMGADKTLSRLQQVVHQFVVHHDGMGTSRDCFHVLHDERGLSVHFLIDNDGTVFQTLDLVDCAFQAGGVNEVSVGVELCSRGDAPTWPAALYKKYPREKVTCTINGHQWLAWNYTKEQFDAMVNIARTLAKVLPGLPQACPMDATGEPIWNTLNADNSPPRDYAGYVGHYHVTNQKWDPGPWDFKKFISSIKGRIFYPALPTKDNVEVPDDDAKAEELANALYDNNEKTGDGGYFPVGPLGATRLWHSGVHLRDERGKPVVAPLAGKIVAARFKSEGDWPTIGSNNFVLLRHDMVVAGESVHFFSLLLHVDAEDFEREKAPGWLRNGKDKKWMPKLKSGEVTVLDEPIGAGDVIAHFGEAGPTGARGGQVHFEIFSDEEVGKKVDPTFWALVEGTAGGRFCTVPAIVANIDYNKNGTLEHAEVQAFYMTNPARVSFRRVAVHHVSEWGDSGDFEPALQRSVDFRGWPPAKRHQVFEDQIASMFWWDAKTGEELGLPADRVVWSYHPITFVRWLHEKTKPKVTAATAIKDESAFKGEKPPVTIKDDASEGAEGFMDDEDALFGEAAKKLDLEQLANGYPD